MKMYRSILLVVLGLLLVGGCTANRQAGTLVKPGQEKVARFFQSYIQAFNSRDMAGLAGHYADDSRTLVSGDGQGYTLDREQLLAAFEMKRTTWENNAVRLMSFSIEGVKNAESALRVDIVFHVKSRTWSGDYPVLFEIKGNAGELSIVSENGA